MYYCSIALISLLFAVASSKASVNQEAVLKLDQTLNVSFQNLELLHNLRYKGKLFGDFFIFETNFTSSQRVKRSVFSNHLDQLNQQLRNDPNIKWFELQKALQRIKRNDNYVVYMKPHMFEEELLHELSDYIEHLERYHSKPYEKCKQTNLNFNDPEWDNQWYLNNGCSQGHSLNITKAWEMGYTGRGVVVTIIDDGLETTNAEIIENYDPKASRDLNDNDYDPQPRYDETNENKHGTRCAGEIAAKMNNSLCGVGVAFNCRIGGIRLLDGKVTDRLEAEALNYNNNHIDIFSASWGPLDDGKTVDGPGFLAKHALINGVTFGRNGKGTIYVWAAGNGGRLQDNCNCDGYTASVFTITIGGVKRDGGMPVYSERCSATLASTFTSGNSYDIAVIAPDIHNKCTQHHSGTSASAPIAAGIIALALEANPELTWRDVQYIIIITSSPLKLKSQDWKKNGIGRFFSHNYGYGLINAGRMVELAKNWPRVTEQLACDVYFLTLDTLYERSPREILTQKNIIIRSNEARIFSMFIVNRVNYGKEGTEFADRCDSNLNYLEHVVSVISLSSGERGKLIINLKSPANTTSNLHELRKFDKSTQGFKTWPFMSVHFWGENLAGLWQLEVINLGKEDVVFKEWYLRFYGVENKNNLL